MLEKDGANFQKGGQAKFWWWSGAICVQSTHVDDESCFMVVFGFDKDFSIGQARVDCNKACC